MTEIKGRKQFKEFHRRDYGRQHTWQLLTPDGDKIDLTDASEINFYMALEKRLERVSVDASDPFTEIDFTEDDALKGTGVVVGPVTDGVIGVTFATGDIEIAGMYALEFEIVFDAPSVARVETFPQNGFFRINVLKDMEQTTTVPA